MRKKRLNFVIVFFIGLLLGITISYVYLAKQEAKPPIKEADLLACQADEDCVCHDGCGCINKQYVRKVYCILILQPCQTGKEVCRCVEGKCKSVKLR